MHYLCINIFVLFLFIVYDLYTSFLPFTVFSVLEKLLECWGRRELCSCIFADTELELPTLATSGNRIPRSISSSRVARTEIFLSKPREKQLYMSYLRSFIILTNDFTTALCVYCVSQVLTFWGFIETFWLFSSFPFPWFE